MAPPKDLGVGLELDIKGWDKLIPKIHQITGAFENLDKSISRMSDKKKKENLDPLEDLDESKFDRIAKDLGKWKLPEDFKGDLDKFIKSSLGEEEIEIPVQPGEDPDSYAERVEEANKKVKKDTVTTLSTIEEKLEQLIAIAFVGINRVTKSFSSMSDDLQYSIKESSDNATESLDDVGRSAEDAALKSRSGWRGVLDTISSSFARTGRDSDRFKARLEDLFETIPGASRRSLGVDILGKALKTSLALPFTMLGMAAKPVTKLAGAIWGMVPGLGQLALLAGATYAGFKGFGSAFEGIGEKLDKAATSAEKTEIVAAAAMEGLYNTLDIMTFGIFGDMVEGLKKILPDGTIEAFGLIPKAISGDNTTIKKISGAFKNVFERASKWLKDNKTFVAGILKWVGEALGKVYAFIFEQAISIGKGLVSGIIDTFTGNLDGKKAEAMGPVESFAYEFVDTFLGATSGFATGFLTQIMTALGLVPREFVGTFGEAIWSAMGVIDIELEYFFFKKLPWMIHEGLESIPKLFFDYMMLPVKMLIKLGMFIVNRAKLGFSSLLADILKLLFPVANIVGKVFGFSMDDLAAAITGTKASTEGLMETWEKIGDISTDFITPGFLTPDKTHSELALKDARVSADERRRLLLENVASESKAKADANKKEMDRQFALEKATREANKSQKKMIAESVESVKDPTVQRSMESNFNLLSKSIDSVAEASAKLSEMEPFKLTPVLVFKDGLIDIAESMKKISSSDFGTGSIDILTGLRKGMEETRSKSSSLWKEMSEDVRKSAYGQKIKSTMDEAESAVKSLEDRIKSLEKKRAETLQETKQLSKESQERGMTKEQIKEERKKVSTSPKLLSNRSMMQIINSTAPEWLKKSGEKAIRGRVQSGSMQDIAILATQFGSLIDLQKESVSKGEGDFQFKTLALEQIRQLNFAEAEMDKLLSAMDSAIRNYDETFSSAGVDLKNALGIPEGGGLPLENLYQAAGDALNKIGSITEENKELVAQLKKAQETGLAYAILEKTKEQRQKMEQWQSSDEGKKIKESNDALITSLNALIKIMGQTGGDIASYTQIINDLKSSESKHAESVNLNIKVNGKPVEPAGQSTGGTGASTVSIRTGAGN